jgi:hypothetical protein
VDAASLRRRPHTLRLQKGEGGSGKPLPRPSPSGPSCLALGALCRQVRRVPVDLTAVPGESPVGLVAPDMAHTDGGGSADGQGAAPEAKSKSSFIAVKSDAGLSDWEQSAAGAARSG